MIIINVTPSHSSFTSNSAAPHIAIYFAVPVKPACSNKANKWIYGQFLKGSFSLVEESKSPQQQLTRPSDIVAQYPVTYSD